ncbi:MAG: hypothetical protein H0V50_08675 [Thermoleophilaceae bacterium]|nr:hypothetical protein [Thermoleophilaceae bacterium]
MHGQDKTGEPSFEEYQLSDGSILLAHPVGEARRCESPIEYGASAEEAVSLEQMPRKEWVDAEECGQVDTRRIYLDHAAGGDTQWSCPTCGGSQFTHVGLYTLTSFSTQLPFGETAAEQVL